MASRSRVINADHEFSAPKLFNYRKGETEEHMHKSVLVGALSYAPSNSTSRTTGIKSLSDLSKDENGQKNRQWKTNLTMAKIPRLQTSLRPRDLKIRISKKVEKEQPERAPKFKARPLNKKILESKGELGLLCNKKRQVTIPKEFHFAINERIPPRTTTHDAELYDKITLCLKSHNKKLIPRNTIPRPFHLHTEKRGAQKESKFLVRIVHKQIEEGRAKIPIPAPKRVHRLLSEVQEFNPHGKMMMEENDDLEQLRKTTMSSFKQPVLPQKSSNGVTKSKSPTLNDLVMKERWLW